MTRRVKLLRSFCGYVLDGSENDFFFGMLQLFIS
jgi:hypothetical protein